MVLAPFGVGPGGGLREVFFDTFGGEISGVREREA